MAGKKIEKELGLTGSPEEQAKIAKLQAIQRGKAARKALAVKDAEEAPEAAAEETAAIEQLTTAEEAAGIEALYASLELGDDGKASATDLLAALADPVDAAKAFAATWNDMLSGSAETTDSLTKEEFVLMAGRAKAFVAEEEDAVAPAVTLSAWLAEPCAISSAGGTGGSSREAALAEARAAFLAL